jgi:cytochrome oxidase Cu insertion factor (SCO1/SenC/PrrC family)
MLKINNKKCVLIVLFLSLVFSKAYSDTEKKSINSFDSFRYQGFLNQFDRSITPSDIEGKLVLVNFVFTGCSATCPIQTTEMAKFQRQLPDDLRDKIYFISISVDPIRDTPKTLLKFAKKYKANLKTWAFLKGDEKAFERVRNEFAAIKPSSKDGSMEDVNLHTTDVSLFDVNGRFVQRYLGAPLRKERLLEDIRAVIRLQNKSNQF